MKDFSPWPCYSTEEADAVREVLLSNAVNQWTGSAVSTFESGMAALSGARHALAFSNGTIALEAALRAVGVGPGDEVVVTPRSFIASASAAVMVGATPVFAEVDEDTELITPQTVAPCLTERTKAVVCVHLAGCPCDMDGFRALVAGRGIALVEDCAQAHGALYSGRPVGALGDIAAWSFCQDKIMTTGGEGGMLTTDDEKLFNAAWSFRDHGKSREAVLERQHPPGFRWVHEAFGTNARMTSMQAAIGSIQLGKLDDWHGQRARNAGAIRAAGTEIAGLRVPRIPDEVEHAWYRCDLFVRTERLADGWHRDRILQAITSKGIPCLTGPCPELYLEMAFRRAGLGPPDRLPVARRLGETCLMFLVHPTITPAQLEKTTAVLAEVMADATIQA